MPEWPQVSLTDQSKRAQWPEARLVGTGRLKGCSGHIGCGMAFACWQSFHLLQLLAEGFLLVSWLSTCTLGGWGWMTWARAAKIWMHGGVRGGVTCESSSLTHHGMGCLVGLELTWLCCHVAVLQAVVTPWSGRAYPSGGAKVNSLAGSLPNGIRCVHVQAFNGIILGMAEQSRAGLGWP